MSANTGRRAWFIFYLEGQRYGIPVECIEELMSENAVMAVRLPEMNEGFTGLVRWRGQVLPRLDLRTVLGMQPMAEQTEGLIQSLTQREADHVKWIQELEASVREDRPFSLATDPHKCAFGKWYDLTQGDPKLHDAFTSRNQGLKRVLDAFDKPHQTIHGIANEVEGLKQKGLHDQAHQLIEHTRDTALKSMLKLFKEARGFIRRLHRSMCIIVQHEQQRLCLVIDSIDLIIEQDDDAIESIEGEAGQGRLPLQVSRDPANQNLIMHMTPEVLFSWFSAQREAA